MWRDISNHILFLIFYHLDILYCDPITLRIAVVLIILTNTVGIIGPMFPIWRLPHFRKRRAFIYISSGVLGTLPIIYYLLKHGTNSLPDWRTNFGVAGSFLTILQYLFGAVLYTNRIPERFFYI
jgi:adiponectin receptor